MSNAGKCPKGSPRSERRGSGDASIAAGERDALEPSWPVAPAPAGTSDAATALFSGIGSGDGLEPPWPAAPASATSDAVTAFFCSIGSAIPGCTVSVALRVRRLGEKERGDEAEVESGVFFC